MPRGRFLTNSLVATLFVVCSVAIAAPASADSVHADDPMLAHCWLDLDTGASLCVDDPNDLIGQIAIDARVDVQFDAPVMLGGVEIQPLALRSAIAMDARASTLVAVLYDDSGFGGGTLTVSSTAGCNAGYASLSASGWNDRASSFRAYNGCRAAVFENEFYGGATSGYSASLSSLGSMNDRASSIRVSS